MFLSEISPKNTFSFFLLLLILKFCLVHFLLWVLFFDKLLKHLRKCSQDTAKGSCCSHTGYKKQKKKCESKSRKETNSYILSTVAVPLYLVLSNLTVWLHSHTSLNETKMKVIFTFCFICLELHLKGWNIIHFNPNSNLSLFSLSQHCIVIMFLIVWHWFF